jgi:hypothetical protein
MITGSCLFLLDKVDKKVQKIPLKCCVIIEQQHGHDVRASAPATATAMATATDRRISYVYNNLEIFSNYLASFLASAHLEVLQKEWKNGPSICDTNINMQIHN